jgi:hypothetical protein
VGEPLDAPCRIFCKRCSVSSASYPWRESKVTSIPERIIDLGEASRKSAEDDFWAIRGLAIQAYANLEQSLAQLFTGLAEMKMDIAQIVFFKITSADSRNKIIAKLFKRKFKSDFNLFRNSLLDQLRPIDIERNAIVHWNVVNEVGLDAEGKTTSVPKLMPPTFWIRDSNTPEMRKNDLLAFITKCDFYSRLLNMFCMTTGLIALSVPIPEADKKPWLDIFAQPIVYPPRATHPLSPTPQASGTPPQSSPA